MTGKIFKKYYIYVGCADATACFGLCKGGEIIEVYDTIVRQVDTYRK